MTRGYLSCAFDLFNVGDLDVIAQVRRQCDLLVVGVHSDQFVQRVTGRPPVVPLSERMALLRHIRGVDRVVVDDEVDHEALRARCRFFAVPGQLRDVVDGIVWVMPRRTTSSRAVLEALAPVSETGVA